MEYLNTCHNRKLRQNSCDRLTDNRTSDVDLESSQKLYRLRSIAGRMFKLAKSLQNLPIRFTTSQMLRDKNVPDSPADQALTSLLSTRSPGILQHLPRMEFLVLLAQ